jgi:signal transduction histidine kinase
MQNMLKPARSLLEKLAPHVGFVCLYVLLDWVSFVDPLHGFNITSWNPPPAAGFIYWLRYGIRSGLGWFCALFIAEGAVRGFPAGWAASIALSGCLVAGYGCIAQALRRYFTLEKMFHERQDLFVGLAIIAVGTLLNATFYISILCASDFVPRMDWLPAVRRYWIGDLVGVLIAMPIFWMLSTPRGRRRLHATAFTEEAFGYLCLMTGLIWFIFIFFQQKTFHHFYFLFLPIVWAAARDGLAGAALVAFVMQLSVIIVVAFGYSVALPLFELQLLLSILVLAGLFIGIVVDERKEVASELNRTLRLAAAGEMAAALAHELNQPITALLAYAKSCEAMLERDDTGVMFRQVLGKVVKESNRAASVVRRLKEFFQTGALRIESVEFGSFVAEVAAQFAQRAQQQGIILAIEPIPLIVTKFDLLQMELVLRNLLENAFDAVATQPEGHRSVSLSVGFPESGKFSTTVTDSGPGVSLEMVQGLFEPFVSSKSSGMGLGLALSRTIVEAHEGKLWAEIGDHGVFTIVLPLTETNTNNAK